MESYLIIKKLLERKKLEQADLANVLKVTPKTAHNYLNGHTNITIDQIPLIARFLKVPISSLFNEGEDLKTLEEPLNDYTRHHDSDALLKQKDETIQAKDETISLLKGQIEYLKSKLES